MPNHKKASHHHGKAGECLSKGDHKGAAHHMGHALSALRQSVSDEGPESADEMEAESMPKPSLRDRMRGLKK